MSECPTSPIVISVTGGYELTSAMDGVEFDIDADGVSEQVAWTSANTALAFLALDRNGNGHIDSGGELFGDYTLLSNGLIAANGFEAVRDLDWNEMAGWMPVIRLGRASYCGPTRITTAGRRRTN